VSDTNVIKERGFSNPDAERRYTERYAGEPEMERMVEECRQCGGCSFFAPLNADYGVCCHGESRHFKETMFEHAGCPAHVNESWGSHSFCETRFLMDSFGDELEHLNYDIEQTRKAIEHFHSQGMSDHRQPLYWLTVALEERIIALVMKRERLAKEKESDRGGE
jgi:hypothetical protein